LGSRICSKLEMKLVWWRMVEDDQNARFSRVVTPYLPDALATARWLTGNRADAEDVVQEACLKAFRAITTFAGGNPRAWVLAIVRNTAYSWLQKNRRGEVVAIHDLQADEHVQLERGADIQDTSYANPETDLITRADEAQLRTVIEKLPPEFREALVLRDLQGLEYREIAEITSVPVGTVMSRLARARRRLINALAQEARADSQEKTLSGGKLKTANVGLVGITLLSRGSDLIGLG
jgi:RNA polymerase sigma factor (sigma-70 family)